MIHVYTVLVAGMDVPAGHVLYVSDHIRALGTTKHGQGDVSSRRMGQPGSVMRAEFTSYVLYNARYWN